MTSLEPGSYHGRKEAILEAAGLRVIESSYAAGTVLPRHAHDHAHFCFVLRGHYAEDVGTERFERRPLDLLWYPPGASHAERFGSDGRHLLVDVNPGLFDRLVDMRLPQRVTHLESPHALGAAQRLALETRQTDAASALCLEGLALELVAAAARSARPRRRPPAWFGRAEEYVHAHYRETVRLADLAELADVDLAHVARTWRRLRGETVGDTVRRLRIAYAARRLKTEETPIARIAIDAGFADQSHLGRTFRRLQGSSPARFRRDLRPD